MKLPLKVRIKAFLEMLKNDPDRLFTGKPKTFKSINQQNQEKERD